MSDESIKSFNFNKEFVAKKKKSWKVESLAGAILAGDKLALSEAITMVESSESADQQFTFELLSILKEKANSLQSKRIAITGPPGVGKSTFIDAFGTLLCKQNHKVAVLAIDPSSQVNMGSIMGDKTRMEDLSKQTNAFIRPSSAGTLLGGINRGCKESILLCEYAGYNIILIESVGIGQSEFWASMISDMTILLLQPGSGDEIQGIKRGIMEMADCLIVNKMDGNQKMLAQQTLANYKVVINLFQPKLKELGHGLFALSSIENQGLEEVYKYVNQFFDISVASDFLNQNRINQELFWFSSLLKEQLVELLFSDTSMNEKLLTLQSLIRENKIDSKNALFEISKMMKSKLGL